MKNETHGVRRRREILEAAADLSTQEGLEGLSFGRLAEEVGLTKAGVAAHFDSKEALQLQVVRTAAAAYAPPLAEAVRGSEPGLDRLGALAVAWIGHLRDLPYRGGCFFASAGQEFSNQPGPVRDAIVAHTQAFIDQLEEQASLAQRLGEVDDALDPARLAFQVHALAQEANLRRELLEVDDAFDHAEEALADLLERVAVKRRGRTRSPSARRTDDDPR